VVINPLRDQPPSLADRSFGMVDAVERGAGLEGQHVVGADLSKLLIRRDNGPFAPTAYLAFQRPSLGHIRSLSPIENCSHLEVSLISPRQNSKNAMFSK
jgi:hypothetical protein